MTDIGQWPDTSELGRCTTAFVETALGLHSPRFRDNEAFLTPHD